MAQGLASSEAFDQAVTSVSESPGHGLGSGSVETRDLRLETRRVQGSNPAFSKQSRWSRDHPIYVPATPNLKPLLDQGS